MKSQISHLKSQIPPFRPRAGQVAFERGINEHRICGFLTRRQYGKTTTAARIALKKMMKTPGHDVVFGSVKLDLGREIVRKEAAAIRQAIALLSGEAEAAKGLLETVDSKTGKSVATLGQDDFDEVYEAQRLEFRLYHSKTIYSRTKVVALTPDAVGETGDLILDEVGRVKKFRDVWEAVKPIISSQPQFRCTLTTTPPPDDSHYSFELLSPPVGVDFPVNPAGNWYRSDLGVWILRVTAWDAYADGIPLYDDDTGEPVDPNTARQRDPDRDAWDRNYGVKFVMGGTAACGLLQLDTARTRGIGECACIIIEDDADMQRAVEFIQSKLGPGPVGLGWDLATTEKETSNPSAFVVVERRGVELIARLAAVWKTKDPDLAMERARSLVMAVKSRKEGGPARRLCIDATNERYFASDARKKLSAELPVELVVGSETIERPGNEPMNMKQWLGSLLVGELDDNHLTLPPERYLKDDFRLVKKEKGQFVCVPDSDGKHGDTFDGTKLGLHALLSASGITKSDDVVMGRSRFSRIPLRRFA